MDITKVNERQFNRLLNKLGKDVNINGEPSKVLFRKSKSKNASESLFIGYPQSYDWNKGTVFEFRGNHYLIVNRDCTESDVYYSSIAKKCNVTILGRHFVAGDLSSPNPKNGTMVNTVNGNIMLYTGEKNVVKLNDIIKEFGGYYKCINTFDIDGLSYYYFQRELEYSQGVWELVRTGKTTTFKIGKTGSVCCILQMTTSSEAVYYDTSAEYTYRSSDESLAVVDNNGNIIPKKVGTVTINCVASDGENEYNTSFSVSIIDAEKEIAITYNGLESKVGIGYSKTLTVIYKRDNELVTEIPTWTFTGTYAGEVTYTQPEFNEARITVSKNARPSTLRCTATYSDGMSAYIDLEVHWV